MIPLLPTDQTSAITFTTRTMIGQCYLQGRIHRLRSGIREKAVGKSLGRQVDKGKLEATGYGETRPIDSNSTVSGRIKNRRVDFVLIQSSEDE